MAKYTCGHEVKIEAGISAEAVSRLATYAAKHKCGHCYHAFKNSQLPRLSGQHAWVLECAA